MSESEPRLTPPLIRGYLAVLAARLPTSIAVTVRALRPALAR